MIVTETEWNQAATVLGDAGPSLPPSYDDSIMQRPPLPPRSPRSTPSIESPGGQLGEPSTSVQNSPAAEEPAMRYDTNSLAPSVSPSPQAPIQYTFVQSSFNSMILTYQAALVPMYHISTYTNCFVPSSYITVIRRGDSESGALVGQFEMGASVKRSTITLDGKEKLTDAVIHKTKSGKKYFIWRWSADESTHLSWSIEGPIKYCYIGNGIGSKQHPVAFYSPPPLSPRADGRPSPLPALKIYPEGKPKFDHILVSALIIERHRLTPSSLFSVQSWTM